MDAYPLVTTVEAREHDGYFQAGGPLHADVTAFLLAQGADPLEPVSFHGHHQLRNLGTRPP